MGLVIIKLNKFLQEKIKTEISAALEQNFKFFEKNFHH